MVDGRGNRINPNTSLERTTKDTALDVVDEITNKF